MIWRNPWAFAGLLALAVPVLVHLLARRSARIQRFPSLRFLQATPLVSARRTRLTDLLLLVVRATIVAAAVAALAQPYLLTGERRGATARLLARAIVVDTSASMLRATPTGASALEEARSLASATAADAAPALVIETAAPRDAIAGATAWLQDRWGRREIVVISDFQLGAFSAADTAAVPGDIGLALHRIAITADSAVVERIVDLGDIEQIARATRVDGGTAVEWSTRDAPSASDGGALHLPAGDASGAAVAATLRAVRTTGAPPHVNTSRPVAIVHAGHPSWGTLLESARPFDAPWMADAAAAIRHAPPLAAAVAQDSHDAIDDAPAHAVPVAWTGDGTAAVLAARGPVDDTDGLVLFAHARPGTLTYAALVRAALHAVSAATPAHELETAIVDDATLALWSRETPAAPATATTGTESDGRWVWLAVLVLLGIETWLRRRSRNTATVAAT